MFTEVISGSRQDLLARLAANGLLKDFYMAGGTAAAIHIGHRESVDFDFFSPVDFDPEQLTMTLGGQEPFKVTNSAPGTLHGLIHDIRLTFLHYRYPLLFPTTDFVGIQLADLKDIALMKIVAVANRGTNKDFIDLYFLCRQVISLEELLTHLFPRKYGNTYSIYHILRSLQYFEDAEKCEPLKMLVEVEWSKVKDYFVRESKQLMRKWNENMKY